MKTLVFSPRVVLDGVPAGFSGTFKMLHIESGQLYVYRVHIPKHIYVGTHVAGKGSRAEDLKWWECMFHALTEFINIFNETHGHLPTDQNIYQDRRSYTSEFQPFGKKIQFIVEEKKRRALDDKELVLLDITENSP